MGERFGQYEIQKRIAAGGMAEVFLAKHQSIGGFERWVCIKRILEHLVEQEDFITMFQDEARIAANLIHPNIAQIYDIGEIDGAYYIAMEYVRGQDLRRLYNQEVARGRAMPLEPAAQVIMGAAAALEYAHRQTGIDGRPLGIVHRDVSPQNIIVTYDGHVKLVDFGVAKAANKMNQTRSGVLKGKYSYMSPEQAAGDPIDGRTDIFALGITLYEVTTGTRLFKRQTELETLHAVIECDVTPPSKVYPGYDEQLEAIIMRALTADPAERYPTAGEMERDLEAFLRARGSPTAASALGEYMQDLFAEEIADDIASVSDAQNTPSKPRSAPSLPRSRSPYQSSEATEIETSVGALSGATVATAVTHQDWAGDVSNSRTMTRSQEQETFANRPKPLADEITRRRKPLGLMIFSAVGIAALLSILAAWFFTRVNDPASIPRSGAIVIDSEPRNATVDIVGPNVEDLNRKYHGFRTAFTLQEGLPIDGRYSLRFEKEGFEAAVLDVPVLAEGVVPDAPMFVELKALAREKQSGRLTLATVPPGAEVRIDGTLLQNLSPLTTDIKGGQMHRLELRLDGYHDKIVNIFVEPGEPKFEEHELFKKEEGSAPGPKPAENENTTKIDNTPKKTVPGKSSKTKKPTIARGYLSIDAPAKLRVRIDGKYWGTTPLGRLSLRPGSHRIEIENPKMSYRFVKKVSIASSRTETVRIPSKEGFLEINARPWANVKIGNSKEQETPAKFSLLEGDYSVQIKCSNGTLKTQRARVSSGKSQSFSVNCK